MGIYFSFNGRLGPAAFQKAVIVLIVIGLIINLSGLVSMQLALILGILGLVMIWPWLAVWVKRYHDADKSGWMVLVPLVVTIILGFIADYVLNQVIPIDKSAIEQAASGGMGAIIQASMEAAKSQMLPKALIGALISLVVMFGFNAMIKSDPEENRFGPPTS